MKGNPYMGLRPFKRGQRDHFYGREKEARDLSSLIMAERVVLFYAPSGAGKTSLLNARVIPLLSERGFNVLPLVRVGNDIPPELAADSYANVFVLSALLDLAEHTGDDPPSLVEHTLSSYLQTLCPKEQCADAPPLLIFDDFEELFTTHQDRWQDIGGFFEQVRNALRDIPELGVVFAMREDYVAELDPYAKFLPKGLRARYRMAGLDLDAARKAVEEPARAAGRDFAPGTVEKLLAALQPESSGAAQSTVAPYVDSLLLQVVLSRLWEKLPTGQGPITWEEIQTYVRLDRALRDFYEEILDKAHQHTGVGESLLRDWIDKQLITPQRTRKPVPLGEKETVGMPNKVLFFLRDQHLLSEDVRLKRHWFQLSHDQLIPAIIASNHDWELKQETPLRTAARKWWKTGDDSLLYRGQALRDAQDWVNDHQQDVLPYERTFLAVSEKAEEERLRKQLKLRRNLIVALFLVTIGFAALSAMSVYQAVQARRAELAARQAQHSAETSRLQAVTAQTLAESARDEAEQLRAEAEAARQEAEEQRALAEKEAETQHQIALAAQLAAQADLIREQRAELLPRSVLLAVESLRRFPSVIGEEALRGGLALLPQSLSVVQSDAAIEATAFSQDGRLAIAGDARGHGIIWDAESGRVVGGWSQDATINRLALNPAGTMLASASSDATVQLISLPAGKSVRRLSVPAPLWDVAFSPDGRWLATASLSGEVRIWDVESGQVLARLPHPSSVWQVAFSPDGRFLATACDDGVTRVWTLGTLQLQAQALSAGGGGVLLRPRRQLEQGASVSVLAFAPQGQWLATGGDDSSVRLWDLTSGQQVIRLFCDGPVVALAFSPDGQRVAAGSLDATARVWALPAGTELALEQHSAEVTAVAFAPDGNTVASASLDHTARVWRIASAAGAGLRPETVSRVVQSDAIYSVRFDPRGRRLLTGCADGRAHVWDLTATDPRTFTVQRDWVNAVAFSPDGSRIVSGSDDGTVSLWRTSDGARLITITRPGPVYSVAFAPDGRRFVSGDAGGTAIVWDAGNGAELARQAHEGAVLAVAFSADGAEVISGGSGGDVRVWDARSGELLHRLPHLRSVWAVAFSPDGQMAATGGDGRGVHLWNIAAEREVRLLAHPDSVWAVAFSPDGRELVSGCADGIARVWDVRSARVLVQVVHENWVTGVGFSPDGQWCVSSSDDSTARVWNANSGAEIAWLMHDRSVRAAAFSPDGRIIATGSALGAVRLWHWQPEDLITEACSRIERNLTPAEWNRYLPQEPYRATCEAGSFPTEHR